MNNNTTQTNTTDTTTTQYTEHFIKTNGERFMSYPIDVSEEGDEASNGSIEAIYEYEGKRYLLWEGWDGKLLWPYRVVEAMSDDE